ncbi:transcriptional regulator (DNA-binding phage protein) [Vitreoscilla filiformis]|jgi:hypothetical protein|uniref:Transcriptional regulator (DNA-binding phage protein) n=1 Tax=Vitreoscilla filiformis TaxID=63 RepID=A0A221KBQ1_VITFI|nr:helix-turn-helix domain-containing protein [Vitreoscilla filiformis]ASM76399.1 transcriptional regulator (DNA-binding phage protein) [Vitreoscilla filiformis]
MKAPPEKFGAVLARLKESLGKSKDVEIADALGMTKTAFHARKERDSFPAEKVAVLALHRPDLKIDVAYVLTGERQTPTSAASQPGRTSDLADIVADLIVLRDMVDRIQRRLSHLTTQGEAV